MHASDFLISERLDGARYAEKSHGFKNIDFVADILASCMGEFSSDEMATIRGTSE